MKRIPSEKKVIERMAPGVLSRDGFLGADTRELDEIIASDEAMLDSMGVTPNDLADRMQEVFNNALKNLGRPVTIEGRLEAVYRESMGRIPSPWPGEGVFQKGEVEVKNIQSGESIRFSPLAIHLIRKHSFFQGRGSVYRLEPKDLCKILGLVKAPAVK